MKDTIKIFGVVLGTICGSIMLAVVLFWLLIIIVDYNPWLLIPIFLLLFSAVITCLITSINN